MLVYFLLFFLQIKNLIYHNNVKLMHVALCFLKTQSDQKVSVHLTIVL